MALVEGGLECEGPDQREIDLCKLLLTDSGYINSWAMRTNKPTPWLREGSDKHLIADPPHTPTNNVKLGRLGVEAR